LNQVNAALALNSHKASQCYGGCERTDVQYILYRLPPFCFATLTLSLVRADGL
jgi:hypothetical protein